MHLIFLFYNMFQTNRLNIAVVIFIQVELKIEQVFDILTCRVILWSLKIYRSNFLTLFFEYDFIYRKVMQEITEITEHSKHN